MSRRDMIESRTIELIQPIIEQCGVELWDVDYLKEGKEFYLRVYIDKPEGVGVLDCEAVSRAFNEILDREDYIDNEYIFEVSSPGLTRPLKKERDFERSIGRTVDVKLYTAADGTKEYTGDLKSFTADEITITVGDEEKTIERKNISGIRLAFID